MMASCCAASIILPIFMVLFLCQLSGAKIKMCPLSCTCQNQSKDIKLECLLTPEVEWKRMCSEFNKIYRDKGFTLDVQFEQSGDTFFPALSCLPELNKMAFTQSFFTTLGAHTFHNVTITSVLDLSVNNITLLPNKIFITLETIQSLNLSHNLIFSLNNSTFEGLISLESLDLSYNRLTNIDEESFSGLKNLQYLNLAWNKLVAFSSWHISGASSLRVLILEGNNLKSIEFEKPDDLRPSPFTNLSSLDISHNPIDCSCTLDYLIKSLQHGLESLSGAERTICMFPDRLQNLSIVSLNETDMTCSKPRNIISYPSREKAAVFKETIKLECKSDGYPTPSIIWITPWGEKFANTPVSFLHQGTFQSQQFLTHKDYEERNVDILSTISVNENNDLLVTHFRGSLSGNFTCIAFNVAGNMTENINLMIDSKLKSVYMQSLLIGGYAASGMLIAAFIVGFIKMNIVRLSHKMCFRVPIFSTAPSVKPELETLSHCTSPTKEDATYFDFSASSVKSVDHEIPSTDLTCSPVGSPAERRSLHIIDTLEEARDRLRYGVGRKVESMRKNVQSIKHSSSVYVQNIMETGSSAASRMKASMASGVETVKSHVQSFKELCGTGDMGMHTISMMSVETDIDTNEQTNIIKQITYV